MMALGERLSTLIGRRNRDAAKPGPRQRLRGPCASGGAWQSSADAAARSATAGMRPSTRVRVRNGRAAGCRRFGIAHRARARRRRRSSVPTRKVAHLVGGLDPGGSSRRRVADGPRCRSSEMRTGNGPDQAARLGEMRASLAFDQAKERSVEVPPASSVTTLSKKPANLGDHGGCRWRRRPGPAGQAQWVIGLLLGGTTPGSALATPPGRLHAITRKWPARARPGARAPHRHGASSAPCAAFDKHVRPGVG